MTTEIDAWVREFVARRGDAAATLEARPELLPIASELDGLYWRQVEDLLLRAAAAHPDRLEFAPDERLLLDLGLLDFRLLPGQDRLRPELLREICAPGAPNQFYLSEWIVQRYRHFVLYGGMREEEGATLSASRIIRDMRGRLYARLAPLFKNLPGFGQAHVDLFLGGRIDETLYAMDLRLEKQPDRALADQRLQLLGIRTRLLTRARERARRDEDLALFDALRELDRQAALRRGPRPQVPGLAPRAVSPREREAFLLGEARFIRSVLWLGVTGSGLARTRSVLLTLQPRIVKADAAPVLEKVRIADPLLPDPASILLAPCIGSGFYEWDRDTVFLPLLATRSPEESLLAALARYRMLLDRFQDGGRLLREYEATLGGEDAHGAFLKDYRAWVLGVGKGFRGALDPARFAFFRAAIGPQASVLFAAREWTGLTPEERLEAVRLSRARAQKGEASFDDHYRLAVADAARQHWGPALQEVQNALRLNPVDGRALLAQGFLLARQGAADLARKKLSECMSLAAGTLWAVYAAEELQGL